MEEFDWWHAEVSAEAISVCTLLEQLKLVLRKKLTLCETAPEWKTLLPWLLVWLLFAALASLCFFS